MIFDRIANLSLYTAVDSRLAAVEAFLKEHPWNTLVPGHYDLFDGIYANVTDNPLSDKTRFESHIRYADLQLVIDGEEVIECTPVENLEPDGAYDSEKDLAFYAENGGVKVALPMKAGYFAVFYPEDAHRPSVIVDQAADRKVVFKIPMV